MRGKPLRNGYQAVIWAIQGDAEWQANSLGLPHWCSTRPCAECDCTSDPCNKGKYFKNIEIDTQEFVKVTHEQALANPCSSNLLFHAIPGVSTKFCRGDALHIMFVGGIHAHLLGSVCHYLCYFDGHGRQKISSRETGGAMGESAGCIQNTGKQNKIDQPQVKYVHRPQASPLCIPHLEHQGE